MEAPAMKASIAILHNNLAHSALTYINWDLSTFCNYSCSYCPERLHDGLHQGPAVNPALRFCERVIRHYRDLGRGTFFKFTGGEPTLYKHLPALLCRIKELGSSVGLNSNASRAVAWWDQVVEYLDYVIFTYHLEFTDGEHFISVVNRMLEREITTHLNLTMLPNRFDECQRLAETLISRCKGASVALKPLTINFGEKLYPYSNRQKEVMHQPTPPPAKANSFRGAMRRVYQDGTSQAVQPTQLILLEENRWSSWNCNAGIESLSIRADGEIYRAVCKQGGSLGNLADEDFSFPESPVKCAKNACSCIADIRISKWLGDEGLTSVARPQS
jgi:hypothetical protein